METALSPLEFVRRARRLYPDREAVMVSGLLRSSSDGSEGTVRSANNGLVTTLTIRGFAFQTWSLAWH